MESNKFVRGREELRISRDRKRSRRVGIGKLIVEGLLIAGLSIHCPRVHAQQKTIFEEILREWGARGYFKYFKIEKSFDFDLLNVRLDFNGPNGEIEEKTMFKNEEITFNKGGYRIGIKFYGVLAMRPLESHNRYGEPETYVFFEAIVHRDGKIIYKGVGFSPLIGNGHMFSISNPPLVFGWKDPTSDFCFNVVFTVPSRWC